MYDTNQRFLIIDTETANTLDDPLVYDVGFAVIDLFGNVYEQHSYIVAELFIGEKELLQSAYYNEKIPKYQKDINDGTRTIKKFFNIKKIVAEVIKKYDIKIVLAHNARFDYKSLNLTLRWLTNSRYRYFFPYGVEIWDTLKMARFCFGKDENYSKFCKKNNYVTKRGQNRLTAEVLYRYFTNDLDFIENHTGLEDVMIEKQIFFECVKKDSNYIGRLWG